jgi:hypothetical protein
MAYIELPRTEIQNYLCERRMRLCGLFIFYYVAICGWILQTGNSFYCTLKYLPRLLAINYFLKI